MTNEEAIRVLNVAKAECEWNAPLEYQEAFNMAIEALKEQQEHSKNTMQNQPDLDKLSVKTGETCADAISRRAAIDAILADKIDDTSLKVMKAIDESDKALTLNNACDRHIREIEKLPSAQPRWILFKTKPLTDEEKEEYPYYDDMLDCQLPENGQRILVNVKWNGHESVQMDEYYDDDGSYLDSGYEIGSEATAWMPLPEPYRGEEK